MPSDYSFTLLRISESSIIFAELLLLFVNPLVIILLIAAGVSGFIGQMLDAGIIAGMVLVGVSINLCQTYGSRTGSRLCGRLGN